MTIDNDKDNVTKIDNELTIDNVLTMPQFMTYKAVKNFFKSSAWKEVEEAFIGIWNFYQTHGFWFVWDQLKEALDLGGHQRSAVMNVSLKTKILFVLTKNTVLFLYVTARQLMRTFGIELQLIQREGSPGEMSQIVKRMASGQISRRIRKSRSAGKIYANSTSMQQNISKTQN